MQRPHDRIDTLLERLNASSADDELKAVVEALLQNYRSMTVFANNIFKRLSERDTIIAENKVGMITLVDFLVASRFSGWMTLRHMKGVSWPGLGARVD